MKIRMLASVTLMPEHRTLDEGDVVDVTPEQGAQLCASGLALPEPASVETATLAVPEHRVESARRKRSERGN